MQLQPKCSTLERNPMTDESPIVYLAGPITGEIRDYEWRTYATTALHRHGIVVLNPLEGKTPDLIGDMGLTYDGELCPTGYASRDKQYVDEADILLANIPYVSERPCIGTFWELGWADAGGMAIFVCSPMQVIRDHLFVRAFADGVFEHLDDALEAVASMVPQ